MTDYIVILEPEILQYSGKNPIKTLEKIKKDHPDAKNVLTCSRNMTNLNGKYIPPKIKS